MKSHVAVWIDHREARIFHIHPDTVDEVTVLAPLHNVHHKHPRGAEGAREHPNDAKQFFDAVGRDLQGEEEILLVGPGAAKLEFLRHTRSHDRAIEPRVVGIETVDHPSDNQMVAYARRYFGKKNHT
jgi:stalled ribosome rescue protein Dom34